MLSLCTRVTRILKLQLKERLARFVNFKKLFFLRELIYHFMNDKISNGYHAEAII